MKTEKTIDYSPGIFDKFKSTDIVYWDDFPDIMWGLGFEMDCGHGCVFRLCSPTVTVK